MLGQTPLWDAALKCHAALDEAAIPHAVIVDIEGLPVITLAKLIEMKIACGSGSLRRTHKDFADVVELIAVNGLGKSFARFVHKSVRSVFRDLVERSRDDSP